MITAGHADLLSFCDVLIRARSDGRIARTYVSVITAIPMQIAIRNPAITLSESEHVSTRSETHR